jgi:DNA-binding MarR family transcriptional regulator
MNTKTPVTEAELAEVLPLLGALAKATSRSAHQVPPGLKALWAKSALAPRHMNALLSLAIAGPMSVSDVSARLGIGLATASLLVGELNRVGVVVRTEDEDDRRRTLVDLAPAYRQAIRGFLAQKRHLVRTALEPMEPRERAALVKGMRALISALEAAAHVDTRIPLAPAAPGTRLEPSAEASRTRRHRSESG